MSNLLVLIFIVLLLLLIILSKIEIVSIYKRDNEDDVFEITITYLKFIKYRFVVSFAGIIMGDKHIGIKLILNAFRRKNTQAQKEYISFNALIKRVKEIVDYYKTYRHTFKNIFEYLKRKIIIYKIGCQIEMGLFDPACTGVVTGLVYAIVHNIFTFISYIVRIKNKEINIIPNFNHQMLKIKSYCIFTISIGNIIYVCMRVLLLLLISRLNYFKDSYINVKTY